MRLLLAEDEKEMSDALVAILTHAQYSVDAVYNGRDALDYLEVGDYDGAILDVMMPEMDGFTVLKNIRGAGNTVPVLMLTAKSEIDDRVYGLDAGADDYLTKPFAMKELLARVRAITRRTTDATSSVFSFGNVTLDSTSYTLEAPGGSEHLPGKEYQLMELFLSNPRQVISTERIMEKVWGYESDTEINVVWVTISGLRKKLNSLGADIEIKAKRGQGYYLEEKVTKHE
ncbi:MAG TPA: DNA-binding response regulator [Lachnospiraceae bacterium]|nr:DNA-binding response regulator [Lachnospiraceae bacterium]